MNLDTVKYGLLEKAVSWITSDSAYLTIKKVVESFMDADMTGEEKRAHVQELIAPLFKELSKILINVAIEIAVAVLKAQMEASTRKPPDVSEPASQGGVV